MHGKGKYWKAGSKKEDPGIDGEWENGIRKGIGAILMVGIFFVFYECLFGNFRQNE
jgi:hypothetical protein